MSDSATPPSADFAATTTPAPDTPSTPKAQRPHFGHDDFTQKLSGPEFPPMTVRDRVVLAGKGALMGTADIIPGVSGGTVALIVGVYEQFVDALKSLHLRWLGPFFSWLMSGFRSADSREAFAAQWRTMQVVWLLNLGVGIGLAVVIASRILPPLLEDHPAEMRGLFFGLVAASVVVPLRMMRRIAPTSIFLLVLSAIATFFLLGNYSVHLNTETSTVTVGAEPMKLRAVAELGPSALTPEQLFFTLDEPTRRAIAEANPQLDLTAMRGRFDARDRANPFSELVVPAHTAVAVPRPAVWFVLVCGVIAICAMLLPGISGSFILVMLGMYYFMVNALRGFINSAAAAQFPATQIAYVAVFAVGALIGLIVFSRVLSWLLHHFHTATLAVLAGLMIGSLRVLWPFREQTMGTLGENVWPTTWGLPTLAPFGMMLVGALVVALLGWASHRLPRTRRAAPSTD